MVDERNWGKARYKLSKGDLKVYIAGRLFNLPSRLYAAEIEKYIFQGIKEAIEANGQILSGYPTYLPYRDSKEDDLHGEVDIFQKIYEIDINHLNHTFGIIALSTGPSQDDGVCMELGYGFGRRIPLIIISTDIQTYSLNGFDIDYGFIIDPIIDYAINEIINFNKLPTCEEEPNNEITQMLRLSKEYLKHHTDALGTVGQITRNATINLVNDPTQFITDFDFHEIKYDYFVDVVGCRDEWARSFSFDIVKKINGIGKKVVAGKRYLVQKDISVKAAGMVDLTNAIASERLIICTDGAEVDAGSSFLVGLGKALNKDIYLINTGTVEIIEGSGIGKRNLIIEKAATEVFSSVNETLSFIS